jgi:Ca2+-binding RTX toxin-like protein
MSKGNIEKSTLLAAYTPWSPGQISYTFYAALPTFYNGHLIGWPGPSTFVDKNDPTLNQFDDAGVFSAFTSHEQTYVTGILSGISNKIGNFSFGAPTTSENADLSFGGLNIQTASAGAYASLGQYSGTVADGNVWVFDGHRQAQNATVNGGISGSGDYFEWAILHEIGHALGLQHASLVGGFTSSEDKMKFSIMSYVAHPGESRGVYDFQLYDIASLQALYGRQDNANSGNTTYADFHERDPIGGVRQIGGSQSGAFDRSFSIWDGGGDGDRIDASQYSGSAYIDLRPGHFSSIGPNAFSSALTASAINANWTVTLEEGALGTENISIAFGAFIEEATGAGAADVIVGNAFSNKITGSGGNDLLFGDGLAIDTANRILTTILGLSSTGLSSEIENSTSDADYRQISQGGASSLSSDFNQRKAAAKDEINGGTNDDLIVGGEYTPSTRDQVTAILHGDDGNDLIIAGAGGISKLYGDDGDDRLIGREGNDILDGGAGNDDLRGGDGNDQLLGADGVDLLQGNAGNDRLTGGKGNDKTVDDIEGGIYGGTGDDLLVTELNDGDDFLDGGVKGFDIFDGTDTVVYKYAQGNSTIEIAGGTGDDGQTPADFGITISGAQDGNGTTGTFGEDQLKSIERAAVEAGSGSDTLILTSISHLENLSFVDLGAGIDVLDATGLRNSITLDLRPATNQQLTVHDGFFVDSELTLRNLENAIGTQFSDVMYAAAGGSLLSGAGGKDELRGGSGNDTLLGGAHDDELWGGDGADTLDGGSGADVLVVDQFDTIGRGEVHDKLYWKSYYVGLSFNNRFRGGSRVVEVNDEQTREEQIQAMLNSTEPFVGAMGEKYEVVGAGLKITMKSGEVVNLAEWTEGEYGIYLETRKDRIPTRSIFDLGIAGYPGTTFAIGPVLTMVINLVMFGYETFFDPKWGNFATDTFTISMLQQLAGTPGAPPQGSAIQGTGDGEPINGRPGDDRIVAGGGDDTAHGSAGDDFVDGGDGNDTLYGDVGADRLEGGSGNDILDGGVGNDTIVTGAGTDTVIIRAGDGSDTIIADAQDIIRFEGVKSTEVVARNGIAGAAPAYGMISTGNVSFSFGADSVTIEGGKFGSIEFADGVVKTASVLARDAIAASTSAGDDNIVGFGTADRLAGGTGNDYLNGLGGSDSYYFASGDGHDRIEDSEGMADRLIFGAGITADDIVASSTRIADGPRAGDVLLRLAIEGTDDWVEFVARDIEEVRFADGTVWGDLEIESRVYGSLSTSGDEVIRINNYIGGRFRPGGGNDKILVGTMGVAAILFGRGSDLDRIEVSNQFDGWSYDLEGYGGFATIILDSDLSLGDLTVARLGDGFSISIAGTSDRVEVVRNYDTSISPGFREDDIRLMSDSTDISAPVLGNIADAASGVTQRLTGTAGNNTLTGTSASEWIAGGGGADTLTGNGGTDLLFGGEGDDILDGGAGRDLLFGEAGNDQLSGGGGHDSLYAGTGSDTLLGGEGNDELIGNGQSTLAGGVGDDRLAVVNGDTILFNLGDGLDIVDLSAEPISINGSLRGLDGSTAIKRSNIQLGVGIDPTLTTLTLEGWSVYININGSTTDRIRLDRQFQSGNLPEIRFDNGTIWREEQIFGRLFNPDNGDDTPAGVSSEEPQWNYAEIGYVYGGGGNDTLNIDNFSSSTQVHYMFTPGSGNDVIEWNIHSGSLHLLGFDPDQVTIARSGIGLGDISLSFAGSTDTIKIEDQQMSDGGGTISDFYFSGSRLFASDIRAMWIAQSETAGDDTVTGFDGPGGVADAGFIPGESYYQRPGNDRIEGGLGNDLMIGGTGDDTYVVNIGDGIDIIRDIGLFYAGAAAGDDALVTDALSTNAIFKRSTADANDLVITFAGSTDQITIDQFFAVGIIEEFRFGDGITLTALDVQQLAIGGSVTGGNDAIKGSAAPDTLTGGAGNDTLDGLAGRDRYLFNIGDGQDVVADTGTTESNILAFGEGISASTVVFQKVGNHLKATVNGTDSITINNQFSAATRPMDYAVFADGTRLTAADIDQFVLASQATTGNDTVTGFASNDAISGGQGNDTLNGGAGNDSLAGGAGNDTLNGQQGADVYIFARGDGIDTIASSGDTTAADIVRFAADIDKRDIAFSRPTPTSPHLVVQVRGTTQSITISNYFAGLAVKQFEFADGTILGSADVSAALVNAAPTASGQAWRLAAREGGVGRIAVPDGLFADDMPLGELVYRATMADGSPLPAWLSFDGHVFQTAADDVHVGTHAIKLVAVDRFGATAERVFALDILNRDETPEATGGLSVQSAPISSAFSYALPSGLFTDDDMMFAASPAIVAGTYTSVHGGSFALLGDGSYTYTPSASYAGDDEVHVPFLVGTARALEIAFAFESTGSVSTGTVPAGLAPAQDSLVLTVRLANGDPLPAWLGFDGAAFSGTPAAGDEGPLAIEIVATDAEGRQAIIPFAIRVGTANSAPVAGSLPALDAAEGEAFSYTIVSSLFTDADAHDRSVVTATLADGSPLPSWLSFDGESFSGTPTNGDVGAISVRVTATDIWGTTASTVTTLTIANANETPVIGTAIANQLATEGQYFTFTIPSGSFADPDTGDVLVLAASLDTGEPLPSWLHFENGVFSGTPDGDGELLRVRVTATDAGGKAVQQHFLLGVADVNDAPTIAETLSDIDAPVNSATVYRIPSSLFADSDDIGYRLSVSLADGSPLPEWVIFDANAETITIAPEEDKLFGKRGGEATVDIRITAIDTRGASVSTMFTAQIVAPEPGSTITGGGSSFIEGGYWSERIDSGPGDHTIRGNGGSDRIVFGLGYGQDEIERGNYGSLTLGDVVEFGAGITLADLTITRVNWLGSAHSLGESLLIKINGTSDELFIDDQFGGDGSWEPVVREFRFVDGTVLYAPDIAALYTVATTGADALVGSSLSETISGGDGDDTIWGFEGDDLIDGGAGNDKLFGDTGSQDHGGSDTFLFGHGSGNDIIFADSLSSIEFDPFTGESFDLQRGVDTLRFGAGITPEDLILTHVPGYPDADLDTDGLAAGSLVIQIAGTSDSVTIDHHFLLRHHFRDGVNTPGIERFEFADGTVMDRAQFEALITLVPATSGDDLISGGGGADRLAGGLGNDILVGEDGPDTYVYNVGDGDDRIIETMWYGRATYISQDAELAGDIVSFDALTFGEGIEADDIIFNRPDANGEDLVITFRNQPGSITIQGQFRTIHHGQYLLGPGSVIDYFGDENAAIDEFRFADGTRWSLEDIYAYSRRATLGDDVIDGFFRKSEWVNGSYQLGETLDGGAGNDLLVGRNGDDTYVFARGYGHDEIKEFGWRPSDGSDFGDSYTAADKIRFVGIASTDVTTSIGAGGSFVFTINNTGETLTILAESEFTNFTKIIFSDTEWNAAQFQARWTVAAATSGNDVINGFLGNDVIDGGDGDDVLQGGQNSGTPQTGLGYDTLNGGNGNDTLTLESSDNDRANGGDGDDIFRFDMTLPYWSSDRLLLADRGRLDYPTFVKFGTERGIIDGGGGNDTLILGGKLADYWLGGYYAQDLGGGSYRLVGQWDGVTISNVETVQFADGTVSMAALVAATSPIRPYPVEGTAGDDVMNGTSGNNALYGRDGNDTLNGGDGDDWLIGGAGTDSYNGGNGFDSVDFGSDPVGWSINLTTGQAVQGGVTETITGVEGVYGSAAADTITGSTGNNILAGAGGNDIINAGDGNDIVEFDFGDMGFDAIDGGNGTDVIRALRKDTVIGLTSISGIETITANGYSYVTISGSSGADTINLTGVTLIGIDTIDGGEGNDTIVGTAAADKIIGREGDDNLSGGDGDDLFNIYGTGYGFDAVAGGGGYDRILADTSNTRIGLTSLSGVEQISGYGSSGVYISGSSTANTLDFTNVELLWITRIDGGSGNDTIYGSAAADVLQGSAGDDTLYGGLGNDTFQYTGSSGGFDTVDGGVGTNGIIALANNTVIGLTSIANVQTISAGAFTGVSILGSGNADTLNFAAITLTGITKIDGGSGNDIITGTGVADTILGSGGDDSLSGGAGNDVFQYTGTSTGFDAVNGGDGTDTIAALANNTVIGLSAMAGVETISSGGFTGVAIAGSSAADTLDFSNITLSGIVSIGGGAGNDVITGTGAADTILGGNDNDTLNGGDGNDMLNGGSGTNQLNGGNGDDTAQYSGAAGSYSVSDNGDGTYALIGTGISDTLSSIEFLAFSDGTVTVASRLGLGLTLTGTASAETLTGGGNADIITGLGGDDTLIGNGGNDEFRYSGSSNGFDNVDGGLGTDTIKAMAASTVIGLSALSGVETITANGFGSVSILGSSTANVLNFSGVTLTNITKIEGGSGNDTITGSSAADTILGSGGDDSINAGDGNDTIQFTGTTSGFDAVDGGLGSDTISALANSTVIGLSSLTGIETISAGSFTGVYIAGSGNADTLNFSTVTLTNIARIEGGGGADIITGNTAANTIWGGLGNDVVDGGSGNDSLLGDDGDDILKGGAGTDTMNGGNAIDTADYSAYTANLTINLATTTAQTVTTGDSDTITNIENVTGGSGTDTLTGSTANNVIDGGGGNDRLRGAAGNDTIIGGTGTSDVAIFAGTQASHTIATNAGVVTITDNQTTTDGNDGTDTVIGIEIAEFKSGVQVGITSPIVLDLNGDGVTLVNNRDTGVSFDWDGDGFRNQTGWIGRDDGFLVFDRDGNGVVSNGGELSFTGDKPGAKSDLDGLRSFDSNDDGEFSSGDEKFGSFRIWRDVNGNGVSETGEMLSLADAGVGSINLAGEAVNRAWAWGANMTINNGSYTRTDGSVAAFGDVALSYDPTARRAGRPFLRSAHGPQRLRSPFDADRAAAQLGEAMAGFTGGSGIAELRFDDSVMTPRDIHFAPIREHMAF